MLPDRYASSPSGNSQSPQNIPATSNPPPRRLRRSEEHTSELQSRFDLVCRLLLEKKKKTMTKTWEAKRLEQSSNTPCSAPNTTPTTAIVSPLPPPTCSPATSSNLPTRQFRASLPI